MASLRSHRRADVIHAVVLVLSLCVAARAAEFAGGTGEPNNPYQITTAAQLIALGSDPNLLDKHFTLAADIDLDPNLPGGMVFDRAVIGKVTGYGPCGSVLGPPFEGTFDGQGHAIRNLTLQASDGTGFLGLFGRLGTHARVLGVRLVDASILAGNNARDVGGLAGSNDGVVLDCQVGGSFAAGDRLSGLGGLVGTNLGVVANSTAYGTITVASYGTTDKAYSDNIGGLVGVNHGAVTCCAADAKITLAAGGASTGGLTGRNSAGLIVNCLARGFVTGRWASGPLGGLVGQNNLGSVINCFSTSRVEAGPDSSVGCLIGSGSVGVSRCYFLDPNDGGITDNAVGTRLSKAQMRQQASYAGWDFLGQNSDGISEVWMMVPGGGYPLLSILHGYQPAVLAGSGTADDPFLIETVEQLGAIVYRPDACYRLAADIDASGITWSSAVVPMLLGSLDGAGHRITSLSVDCAGHAGLVGRVRANARIADLAVEDAIITGAAPSRYVGALAGVNQGLIHACHATGIVTGTESVGGLVGQNTTTISQSWTDCSVSSPAAGSQLGGLVGGSLEGVIAACYALGPVVGEANSVGGLVGSGGSALTSWGTRIVDSYARGPVHGIDYVGGLVGHERGAILTRCFSVGKVQGATQVGGLAGATSYGRALNCLWDAQAGGVAQSAGGLGFNTSEMMSGQAYALNGWAGDPNWVLDEGRDYPHLAWEGTPGRAIPSPVIDWPVGSGTAEAPFKIQSPQQLWTLAHASVLWDKHFVLDADLDLADMMFEPIASTWPFFTGTFDGAGHMLRNLTIRRDNEGAEYMGLFGGVGGQLRNLVIEDANVVSASRVSAVGILAGGIGGTASGCRVTGRIRCGDYSRGVGGLAGGGGAIRDCHADVAIVAGKGSSGIGGLVGSHGGSAPLEDCSATGSIEVLTESWGSGGLVGHNFGPIARCCARGSVTADGDSGAMGGLIGGNDNDSQHAIVVDCYATGRVQGRDYLGGLIGDSYYRGHPSQVERCWAAGQVIGQAGGGLIGSLGDLVLKDCYFLSPTSGGGRDNKIGTALTSEQMKQQASFAGWDFGTVWSICEGKDYPRLRWEQVACE